MHKNSAGFAILLTALGTLPPLSTDMGLPALPIIATALSCSSADAAMTLSLFLIGFAIAPLLCGPLSDRVGRRPVLLVGSAAFAVAALGCTFAPSISILLFCRLVQGIAAGAASVVSMAVVRDLYEGAESRSRLAQLAILRGVGPMIAPTLGTAILTLGSWRLLYGALAIIGIAVLVLVNYGFDESITPSRKQLSLRALAIDYMEVFKNKITANYMLLNAFYAGAIFTYITNSPLLFIDHYGLSNRNFAFTFAAISAGLILGSLLNAFLAKKNLSPEKTIHLGLSISSITVVANFVLTLFHCDSPYTLVPGFFAITCSAGLMIPTMTHKTIEPLPAIAGAVSAMLAATQMIMGALGGMLVSYLYDGKSALAMTGSMLFFVITAASIYLLKIRPLEKQIQASTEITREITGNNSKSTDQLASNSEPAQFVR